MTSKEVQAAISKLTPAQVLKLKALGRGIQVHQVMGDRVLVKTVTPFTEIDRLEKEGLLVAPKEVKEKLTPLPSTGVIVLVGEDVPCQHCWGHKRGEVHHLITDRGHEYVPIVDEGEMVMFSRYSGTDFTIDEESGFRVLDRKEILCTLLDTQGVVAPVEEE